MCADTPTTGLSVTVLRISQSGKAVEILDTERPADDQTLWVPISILDAESSNAVHEAANTISGPVDINVPNWFLQKEGWI